MTQPVRGKAPLDRGAPPKAVRANCPFSSTFPQHFRKASPIGGSSANGGEGGLLSQPAKLAQKAGT